MAFHLTAIVLHHPIAFLIPLTAIVSVAMMRLTMGTPSRLPSFLASCGYLASMMIGAAAGLFPVLLPVVGTQGHDLTIARAISGLHALRVGLAWWSVGMCLALIYFGVVYWLFRGKVPTDAEGYGH